MTVLNLKGVSMANRLLTTVISIGVAATALHAAPAFATEAKLKGAGSSYANKFIVKCAKEDSNTSVSYNPAGSGAGRTAFGAATVDFGASDAASSISSWSGIRSTYGTGTAYAKWSYIPVVGGPIAMLYNIPGISSGQVKLDSDTIAGIMSGKIKKWDDAKIVALQDSAVASKLPNKSIRVVYRSASSGTSENLTDYLRQNSPKIWTKSKNGTIASGNPAGRMPGGSIGAANAQALVSSVKSTKYAIGYADFADAKSSSVSVAKIKNPNGDWVAPSSTASEKFLETFYGSSGLNKTTGAVTLNFKKKIQGAYNMSLIAYAIVDKGATTTKSGQVEDFVLYMLNTCGPNYAEGLGYTAISGQLKSKAVTMAQAIKQ
jgi:phosphate transport system substrate-binding protein